MKSQNLITIGTLFTLFTIFTFHDAIRAEVPRIAEPDYAEALLSYRAGKLKQAEEQLKLLFSSYPRVIEFRELKALIEKGENRFEAARQTYESLLAGSRSDPKRRSLYEYELGSIHFQLKDFARAKTLLESSIRAGTNIEASHLILGISHFELKDLHTARAHLKEVIRGQMAVLKPQAAFYLAHIAAMQNRAVEAVQYFLEARQLALEQRQTQSSADVSMLTQKLMDAVEAQLRPLQGSTFLLSIGWLAGYDSNQYLTPRTDLWIGESSSVLSTLLWGLTYATSPIASLQWVPSIRGSLNYNFNRNTRTAQFVNNGLGLIVTKDVLARSNVGARVSINSAFQYSVDPSTDSGTYALVNLNWLAGPFFKVATGDEWVIAGNLFVVGNRSLVDDQFVAEQRQSGWAPRLSLVVARTLNEKLLNPGASLFFEINQADGVDYRSRKIGLDIGNTVYWSDTIIFSTGVGVEASIFPEKTNGERRDQTFSLITAGAYRLTRAWTVIGNLAYFHHLSNQRSFQYNRLQFGLGVSWVG